MAIEPLGSMKAIQMQSTTKAQSSKNTESHKVKDMDINSTESIVLKTEDTTKNVIKDESDTVKKVVNVNRNLSNTEAVFGIHDGTNRVTIKIIDKDTREVIKELPPEKTLDMIEKMWEMAGILVDEKR